ncbi:hypothetical protein K439DRAFT_1533549 [Ramaria rubella]|nr:hypothetical protein K439DRAFT_1533549 [Ramaria rubella]
MKTGIRAWAVKDMYLFCVKHDLQPCWAYLWENWYTPGRWKLWARSEYDKIPRLKTTMICESHWGRIKHDYLHHFHKPRLDVLVWVIMTKLIPPYHKKLDELLTYKGCFHGLPSWRKAFKREWRQCEKKLVQDPENPKYTPDPWRWVCTCPSFVKSRFLICKHLVQEVHPVPPHFFLQASHKCTTLFWEHPDLRILSEPCLGPKGCGSKQKLR